MANRKRNIQMKFYVTENKKRLIDERIKFIFGKVFAFGKDTFKDSSFFIKASISLFVFFLFLLTDEFFSFVL